MPNKKPKKGIAETAKSFNEELLAVDRETAIKIIEKYSMLNKRIDVVFNRLYEQLKRQQRSGAVFNETSILQTGLYDKLYKAINTELVKVSKSVTVLITRNQKKSGNLAIKSSKAIGKANLQEINSKLKFATLDKSAINFMSGFLGNGQPIESVVQLIPDLIQNEIKDKLAGLTVQTIAKNKAKEDIKNAIGQGLHKSLIISRSEAMRVFRNVTHQSNLKNGNLGSRWVWVARYSKSTCASCIALSGTIHPISEEMRSHPRCRCYQLFLADGVESNIELGVEWLKKQDPKTQKSVIGSNIGFEAYKSGILELNDFVGKGNNAVFGDYYYQLSVKKALEQQSTFQK